LPIARLPLYILLLKEMSKYCYFPQEEKESYAAACAEMQHVAEYVNERKREMESALELENIAKTIKNCPPIAAPGRIYVRNDTITLVQKQTAEKVQVYLCSDCLLITNRATFLDLLDFRHVHDLEDIQDSPALSNSFRILVRVSISPLNMRYFTFSFTSKTTKDNVAR